VRPLPTLTARATTRIESQSGCRSARFLILARLLSFAAIAVIVLTGGAAAGPTKTGDLIGEMHEYYIWRDSEDMLEVARADELGLMELMAANPGVDPWLPGRNTHLLLPTMHILPDGPRKGIVINTAELRLYYYDAEDGYFSFPLGVGRDGYLTPVGSTKIVRKKEKPSWYLTPSEIRDHPELPPVIPPGEDNPLGDYAMYLGWHSYLIHGTNTPWGIGRRTSRGCIRMYPEDIEWLFHKVPIGTQVTVVDQPVKLGWKDGELYIEVQPSTMQIDKMEETSHSPGPPDPIPLAEQADRILMKAGEDSERLDWPAIEQALADRQGYPIRITKPVAQSAQVEAPAAQTQPGPTPAATQDGGEASTAIR
jgi:L,D-transpeptidase ErfK/SrfK